MAELIQKTDSLDNGRVKLNDAIEQSNRAEVDSAEALGVANQALINSERTQTQLDTIVVEGDSSIEAAQARLSSDGTKLYTTLKQRLDTEHEELATQLVQAEKFAGQADFVNLIKDMKKFKEIRVKKISNPYNALSIFAHDGHKHVTHEWRKNTNDDYWIYHTGFTGTLSTYAGDKQSTASKTGSWTEGENSYTTEVGATFTVYVKGERLQLNHLSDNRGGIFDIVINGDTQNPIRISTYSDVLIGSNNTVIADGLDPNATHTVVGTFKGADPNHPPTGGTARGWIKDAKNPPNINNYTMFGGTVYNGRYSDSTNKTLLGYGSNKGWAFSISKDNVTHWFPEHNSVGTAFNISPPKLIVDSVEIDFDRMVDEQTITGVNVQFIQHVACGFSGVLGDIAAVEVTHSFGIDGVVSVVGKLEVLQACKINSGYTLMLPLNQNVLKEFVSAIGNSKISAGNETLFYFSEEKDKTYSFCGVDSANPNYIAAVSFDYPFKTLRANKNGRKSNMDQFVYLHQRATYPKLYAQVFDGHDAVVGESYIFQGRYAIAEIPNVYKYVK